MIFDSSDNLYIFRLSDNQPYYWFIKLTRTGPNAPYAFEWAKEFQNGAPSKPFTFRPGQILVNEKINAIVMGGYLRIWSPKDTHTFAVGLLKNGPSGSGSFSRSSKDRLDILNVASAETFTKSINVRLFFESITDQYFGCMQMYISDIDHEKIPTLFSFRL